MASSGEAIALDTDAQAQLAARWEEYADAVEASGQPPVQPEALREQLGAIYEPYVQAKAGENLARQQAYQRVAAEARAHAAKLRNHKVGFEQQDEDMARQISAITANG